MGSPGFLQHGTDQLAGDGDSVAVLLVTLTVEEERRDDDDVGGRSEPERSQNVGNRSISKWRYIKAQGVTLCHQMNDGNMRSPTQSHQVLAPRLRLS